MIEKNKNETFDCGEYNYLSKFFSLKRKKRMKLPIDIYKGNLLILGCYKSYRRRFANNYAKTLVKKGIKVIYITDALSSGQYKGELERNSFIKHIGLNDIDEKLINTEELSINFNEKCFNNGELLSIIYSKEPCKTTHPEFEKEYNIKLINFIKGFNSSGLTSYDSNEKIVIIIDEDASDKKLDKDEFNTTLRNINSVGSDFVICGSHEKRYVNIEKSFKNYIFFMIRDPNELIKDYSCFSRYAVLNCRDLRNLGRKEFFYKNNWSSYWSHRVSFEAEGCSCCKLEAEDYYLRKTY
jgi:hypothetical protein